jgi:hypothetical protein
LCTSWAEKLGVIIELARARDSYIVKLEPDNGRRSLSNDENCTLFLGGPVCSLMGYGPTNSPNLRTGSPYFNIMLKTIGFDVVLSWFFSLFFRLPIFLPDCQLTKIAYYFWVALTPLTHVFIQKGFQLILSVI